MNKEFHLSPRPPKRGSTSLWRRCAPAGAALLLGLTGCTLAGKSINVPVNAVNTVMPSTKTKSIDPAVLQANVQRFADEFSSRTVAAIDDYARHMETPEEQREALQWKISTASAAWGIASGPNPIANLLDLVALATVTRNAVEQRAIQTSEPASLQGCLTVTRSLETNAWRLANEVLRPDQQEELRGAIRRWWDASPGARTGFFARPEELGTLIRQSEEKSSRAGGVFSIAGMDPTAGLDPAVREVTRSRLFAERAMFIAQRMPFLVRWQVEMLSSQLLHEPQLAAALASANRISRAAESASQAAAQLPDRITAEREAVLAALESQEGTLRELSADVTRTLAAGEKMSASLNVTLITFDAVMKRLGVGEPRDTAPANPEAEPFRIREYGQTAAQLEAAARQLTELLNTADQTLASTNLSELSVRLGPVIEQAQAGGKELVNYAFWRAVLLLQIILAAALLYRVLSARSMAAATSKFRLL